MKPMAFDNLEHEALYEFLNAKGIIDKTEFDSIIPPGTSFAKAIEKINKFSVNTSEFLIFNRNRKWFGYISIYFKLIIRKILRWYINPIIERQNKYNVMVVELLRIMNKNIEELKNEVTILRRNMNIIEK